MVLGQVGRQHFKCWPRMDWGAFYNTHAVPLNKNSTSTIFIPAENQCTTTTTQEIHLCVLEPKRAQACSVLGCKRA